MNHDESARLCRVIAGLAPAQAFDETTPALWQGVLADVRLVDAMEAVKAIARRQPFVAPADVIAEVRSIRSRRLDGVDRLAHLAETPEQWRQIIRRVADGEIDVPAAVEGVEQDPRVAAALPGMFRRPPRPRTVDRAPLALPAAPPPIVDPEEAAELEAERARQLAALAPLIEEQQP